MPPRKLQRLLRLLRSLAALLDLAQLRLGLPPHQLQLHRALLRAETAVVETGMEAQVRHPPRQPRGAVIPLWLVP